MKDGSSSSLPWTSAVSSSSKKSGRGATFKFGCLEDDGRGLGSLLVVRNGADCFKLPLLLTASKASDPRYSRISGSTIGALGVEVSER